MCIHNSCICYVELLVLIGGIFSFCGGPQFIVFFAKKPKSRKIVINADSYGMLRFSSGYNHWIQHHLKYLWCKAHEIKMTRYDSVQLSRVASREKVPISWSENPRSPQLITSRWSLKQQWIAHY